MLSVNIAALKARLSFYLGQVKQGNEVLVLERKTPVARLSPSSGGSGMAILSATKKPGTLKSARFKPLRRKTDVVALLQEDRARR